MYIHSVPIEANCITADTLLKTVTRQAGLGKVYAVTLVSDAKGGAATLILYDNTVAAGERELVLAAAAGTSESVTFPDSKPLRFNTGIYADIAGGAAYATIQFD